MVKKEKSKIREFVRKINEGDEKAVNTVVFSFLGLLLILLILNVSIVSFAKELTGLKISEIEEANRPAKIELSVIGIDCADCQDIGETLDYVRGTNVEVLNERTLSADSQEAKEIIENYGISKLPTVVVSGEIDKTSLKGFSEFKDSLVYDGMTPPYFDVLTGEIRGKVEIINIIDSSCEECISLEPISNALIQAGVAVSSVRNIEYDSEDGKTFVEEYEMNEVPSILISKEVDYYGGLKQQILALSPTEKNGFYKIHSTNPPFRNLTSNEVVGLVDIIYINDSTCGECYNVKVNKQIIQNLGIYVDGETIYDISSVEGQEIISKYNIKRVPMIIISSEAGDYNFFRDIWTQVGTEEDDGWFIMRKPELVGTFKEIETGTVVNPSS